MKNTLVNFYITLFAFLQEVRALWVLSSTEQGRSFMRRGGAERLDELESEREEFDSVIETYQHERQELNADLEYLRGDNKALRERNDTLMSERVSLLAANAELIGRLNSLRPDQVAAVVLRGRAVAMQNARLDALAKLALAQQPAKAGSGLN